MSHPRAIALQCVSRPRSQRQGVTLICVVACLAVATLLLGTMLKTTVLTRRQVHTERHLRQAQWLVEAGAERAAFRLGNDADYTGERWSLQPEAIVGTHAGVVNISVNRRAKELVTVRVVAEYPAGGVTTIRRTRDFQISLPQE